MKRFDRSKFFACAFGSVALISDGAYCVAPAHPLPVGVTVGAAIALALWATWERPKAAQGRLRRRSEGPTKPPATQP